MVMVLEKEMVEEISRIGVLRSPCEAAGILLPFPFEGRQIIELPNRSSTPHDFFEMAAEDLILSMEKFVTKHPDPSVWNMTVIWHTHPAGHVGPSTFDMQNKVTDLRHLVVSLHPEGEALATWY